MTRTPSGVIRLNITSGWRAKFTPPRNTQNNLIHEQRYFFRRVARRVRKYQRRSNYGLIYSHYVLRCFLNRFARIKIFFYDGAWCQQRFQLENKRRQRRGGWFRKKAGVQFNKNVTKKTRPWLPSKRWLRRQQIRHKFKNFYIPFLSKRVYGKRKRRGKRKGNFWLITRKYHAVQSLNYPKYSAALKGFFKKNIWKISSSYRVDRKGKRHRRFWLSPRQYTIYRRRRSRSRRRLRSRLHQVRMKVWRFRFVQMARSYFGKEVRISVQFFGSGKMTASSVSRYIIGALTNRFRITSTSYRFINGLKRFRFNKGSLIQASGRFDRKQIAFYRRYGHGKVGINLFRSKTRYSLSYVRMKFGVCGIKVWLPDRTRRIRPLQRRRVRDYKRRLSARYKEKYWSRIFDWREYQRRFRDKRLLFKPRVRWLSWLPYSLYKIYRNEYNY